MNPRPCEKNFTEVVALFTGFIETPKATGKLFQDKETTS